jgi:hypothetical protein
MPDKQTCGACGRPYDDEWVVYCPVSRTLADMLRDDLGMTTEYPVTMKLGAFDVIEVTQHCPDRSTPPVGSDADQGWWVIQGNNLLGMLREVADGADPDMVFTEHYVNCEHEHR